MKLDKIIKFLIIGVAIMFSSCVKEVATGKKVGTTENDGLIQVPLHTYADDYTQPTTRVGTANENTVGVTPWVLVFIGNNDNATFYEAAQAFVKSGKTYVLLEGQSSNCKLLIIANPPATFFNGTSEVAFNRINIESKLIKNSTTFAEAANTVLLSSKLDATLQTTVPYTAGLTIPMSGVLDVPKIDPQTKIGDELSKFMLDRIVAKVTVKNTDGGFNLLAAAMVNAPRNGRLYQLGSTLMTNSGNQTQYLTTLAANQDGVSGIAPAVSQTTADNPIYVYESKSTENTSVIIKGKFSGTDYYYRLAFVDNNFGLIDIIRNKHYSFNITKISGPGYASIAEARTAPASNVIYTIKVTDLSSFDMMDNGSYYMGVSNSEYIVYTDQAENGLIATTIATNAPTGVTTRNIFVTSTPSGSMTLTTSNQKITVSGSVATTDVKVNLTAGFQTGTITLHLGNLLKTITVKRQSWLGASGFDEVFQGDFVSGMVSTQGDGGSGWLAVSDGNIKGGENFDRRTPGPIYINGTPNYKFQGGAIRSGGEVFLERDNNQGRVKVLLKQNSYEQTKPAYPSGYVPYVGTFHRWNETGERLIRIKRVPGMEGDWTAKVVAGDFIKMDKNIRSGFPYNDNNAEDPANQVSGTATTITGNLKATDDYLEFRVGMTGKLASATTNPRYGLILLSYGNHTFSQPIYVRQGEAADYVMRKTGENAPGSTATSRPNANKFCVYNVSAPGKTVSLTWAGCEDVGPGQGVFTEFPTQQGYLFQFAHKNKAIHPSYPVGAISGWMVDSPGTHQWATSYDSCPTGYRRPSIGPAYSTSISAVNSEYVSSLVVNPPEMVNIPNIPNRAYGYYADGFFDRRAITKPSGAYSATDSYCVVADGTAEAAYIGTIYYNPSTNAAIFFPGGGIRYTTTGELRGVGGPTCYWSSTTTSYTFPQAWAWYPSSYVNSDATRSWAMPVRCVKQ